jgi:signal transduction histidine kinase
VRGALVRIVLAVSTAVVLAFGVPLALLIRETAADRALADAADRATAVATGLAPALAGAAADDDPAASLAAVLAAADADDGRTAVRLPGAGGGESVSAGDHRAAGGQLERAAATGRSATHRVPGGASVLRPVPVGDGPAAVVEVFVPDAELTAGVTRAWLVLAGLGLVLVAGAAVVADRLGSGTVRATARLAAAATELGDGRLGVRARTTGPAELRAAATAFNAMADRVAHLLASERELAADLSHRLRTPLTALRLNTASLGDGDAAEQTRQAVAQLEREVDQIIRTARGRRSAAPVPAVEHTDAAEVIRERMGFWSALAEDQGREVRLAGVDEPMRVPVARADLAAAMDALLGNVFRHTPEGTAFAVDVHRADGAADAVIVLVSDAGPGIDDPDAALRRGTGSGGPGSTGLGLDIARRLAESTGGDLRVGRSVLGGAEIRLWLARDGGRLGANPAPPRRRGTRRRGRGHASADDPGPAGPRRAASAARCLARPGAGGVCCWFGAGWSGCAVRRAVAGRSRDVAG